MPDGGSGIRLINQPDYKLSPDVCLWLGPLTLLSFNGRGVCVWSLFCYAILSVRSSCQGRQSWLLALFKLSSWYRVVVNVLCLFPSVMWVGLQCVIVVYLGHTH